MGDLLRRLIQPSLVALVLTGAALALHVVLVVVPLIDGIHGALDSQARNAQAMLAGPAGLALSIDDRQALDRLVVDISNAPLVAGIVIANSENRVVAAAWAGKVLAQADAVDRIVREKMQRWPVTDDQGRRGMLFVALDDAWPKTLERDVLIAVAVDAAGILVFSLFAAIYVRQRLATRVGALQDATASIARGDYDVRVPVRGRGPVAELSRNFNRMTADLDGFTRRLRTSEERLALAVGGSNEAIWDWNVQSDSLYLSPRYAEFIGGDEREVPRLLSSWRMHMLPDDQASFNQALDDHLRRNAVFRFEYRAGRQDGTRRWLLVRGNAVRNVNGTPVRMVGSIADITDLKRVRNQLDREQERAEVTLQSIDDAVITIDKDARINYMNPAAERMLGWTKDQAMARTIQSIMDFVSERDTAALEGALTQTLRHDGPALGLGQTELLSKSGERRVVEHNMAPIHGRDGRILGGVIVMHDITDRFQLLQQLAHQAMHDPLTQLVNRTGFERRLKQALQPESNKNGVTHCICYMDLDQFKTVNDTCGHAAGDELLQQISEQLRRHVRKEDTLARLGGDEFGLQLWSCPLDKAKEIAEKMRRAVESFRFSWEGKTFSVGVSIGLAPFGGQPGATVASVMSAVDQACYIAKSNGRNRIHVYQPGDEESSRWHNEVQWVPHIHRAMDEGHFVLMAQPIVAINPSLRNAGPHFEILLRMRGKDGELISPGSFLPAAERYDLMAKLDRWVVKEALKMLTMALVRDSRLVNATFGINISGAVLTDNGLLDHVKETLAAYRLPPSLICFEITETIAIANFTHAHRFVKELKEIGCSFALDDFGSGFASFSYLKTMPVDYLKIDGSFVRHLVDNDVDHTMVDIINQLGHVMKLKTIAEFVETPEVLDSLRRLGVDYAQGYHLGRPMPLQDVLFDKQKEAGRQAEG
jgi:diguanylate cyclase (GGDEF)-like protein/PAS domain S-box-containing protein